jgi:hypothetical protein
MEDDKKEKGKEKCVISFKSMGCFRERPTTQQQEKKVLLLDTPSIFERLVCVYFIREGGRDGGLCRRACVGKE